MNNSIDLKLMGDAMSLLVPLVMNNSLFCMNVVISSHANCELLTDDNRGNIYSNVKLLSDIKLNIKQHSVLRCIMGILMC